MQVTLSTADSMSADIQRLARVGSAEVRRAAMAAVGEGLKSMAKRAFATDPSLRPLPWKAKADGTPSTLQKSTRLRQSITVTGLSDATVTVGSDAAHASIHQTGGRTRPHIIRPRFKKALAFGGGVYRMVRHPGSNMPPRPYLPFHADGRPTAAADRMITWTFTKKLGLDK